MKKIFFLILINSLNIQLQAQNFEWSKREGQAAYDYGYGMANDHDGNIYIAGKYELFANFSGTILPCQGNHDIYVAKYSPTGALIWIRTAGGITGDYAHALSCDGNYVYVAGEIQGSGALIKFLGSPITLVAKGSNDAFLAKYDLDGNLIWAQQAGGTANDEALGITSDNAGNVFICGFYNGNATFGTTTVSGQGANDIYIAKYDSDGVFQWVRTAGGPGRDEAKSIKCDAAGNIYICGLYENATVFGSQLLTSPNGFFNSFLAKYSTDGTLEWVKTAGGDYDDVGWALTIDNSNKIYVTGEFNSYAHFDGISISTNGSADVFVACYDPSGNIVWVKKAGGNQLDRARGIGCDGVNLYITGQFDQNADFGPYPVSGNDHSEIFIAKLNNAGEFQWVKSIGGPPDGEETLGYESGDAICAEPSGNVYATGALLDGGLFGTTSFNGYGHTDVFITKITQSNLPSVTFIQTLTICSGENLTVGTHIYTTNGNYTDLLTSYQNFDSIVVTHLTVLPENSVDQSKTICAGQSIIVGTHTYTSSGNYTDVLTSFQNCDSTITTNLTILPVISFAQTLTLCAGNNIHVGTHTYNTSGNYTDILSSFQNCDSTVITHLTVLQAITFVQSKTICAGDNITIGIHTYNANGNYTDILTSYQNCDSIVTTHLTVLQAIAFNQIKNICAGNTLTIGNNVYDASGNYTDVLTSFAGCDSTITTHLTVDSVDILVTVSSSTLTANASSADYQWIDCDNGSLPITGQTSQNFSAITAGNFAVVVTQNGCTDTSSCYSINSTGIIENSFANFINIYPNPTTGTFTLEFCFDNLNEESMKIEIFNPEGKSIYYKQIQTKNGCIREIIELEKDLAGGVFILDTTIGNKVKRSKLMLVK